MASAVRARISATGLQLDADARQTIRRWVGKEVEIRPVTKRRSLDQNAWIWGVAYPLIAEELGYDRDEHDDLHYALLAECFGRKHSDHFNIDVPAKTSSKLTTGEFSEYMEWLVRFAAKKWGVNVPLPDEEAA